MSMFVYQYVHIHHAIQWIQICNPCACVQSFTLIDHFKLTSLVLLNIVIYMNILGTKNMVISPLD